jgi:hypothetical protein
MQSRFASVLVGAVTSMNALPRFSNKWLVNSGPGPLVGAQVEVRIGVVVVVEKRRDERGVARALDADREGLLLKGAVAPVLVEPVLRGVSEGEGPVADIDIEQAVGVAVRPRRAQAVPAVVQARRGRDIGEHPAPVVAVEQVRGAVPAEVDVEVAVAVVVRRGDARVVRVLREPRDGPVVRAAGEVPGPVVLVEPDAPVGRADDQRVRVAVAVDIEQPEPRAELERAQDDRLVDAAGDAPLDERRGRPGLGGGEQDQGGGDAPGQGVVGHGLLRPAANGPESIRDGTGAAASIPRSRGSRPTQCIGISGPKEPSRRRFERRSPRIIRRRGRITRGRGIDSLTDFLQGRRR